ncbi:MAG TPA: oxygenase MpaB family protein [Actinomycetota bacterium]|nr:oxygenase MpaB family protein [Actinomycetota bacterium]
MAGLAGPPFGRGTVTWRVNLEPVTFLGASRALLLQVAHPLVAAGVAQHSDYTRDPWRRLFRTLDLMVKLGFGSPEVSERQRRRLLATHAQVHGVAPGGVPYRALDPDLMMWVLATLIDTSVVTFELVLGPLPAADRERYYQESRGSALAIRIDGAHVPASWPEFEAYVARVVDSELRVTPEAMAVARSTFELRRPTGIGPVVGRASRLLAAGLLPEPVRIGYGLAWDERSSRRLDRVLAAARILSRLTPRSVRRLPVTLVAQRRP